jgi:hypothetical protein
MNALTICVRQRGHFVGQDVAVAKGDAVVDEFWRYHALTHGTRGDRLSADQYFWAWEAVQTTISEHPAEAVELIADLVRSAVSDDDLVYVGAGPLEGLVSQHGSTVVERIDELARQDSRFRRAVNAMWLSDAVPVTVRDRLARFRERDS